MNSIHSTSVGTSSRSVRSLWTQAYAIMVSPGIGIRVHFDWTKGAKVKRSSPMIRKIFDLSILGFNLIDLDLS